MSEQTPRVAVITVSDRVFQGVRKDASGPLAAELLGEAASIVAQQVVPDGIDSVRDAVAHQIRQGANVVITTGGTGIAPRDLTPQATRELLIYRTPGVENAIRQSSNSPTAQLSRGVAGVALVDGNRAFVCNVPGSEAAVREAAGVIVPILGHVVSQLSGGDHQFGYGTTVGESAHEQATRRSQNRGVSSGLDARVVVAEVSEAPIVMEDLISAVDDDSAGAVTSFCGQVRNHDDSRSVLGIEYQAHPDASALVRSIANELAASSGACKIAVVHRAGTLRVGDVALGAAVSASHRAESFKVLEQLVEQVKMRLPVWKKQQFADGTHEWTGAA